MKSTHLIFIIAISWSTMICGQNVEAFGSRSQYGVRGGINIGSHFYTAIGDSEDRLAPFGYRIQGHISGQVGAVTIPVSFSFNHLDGSISSPFNLYGASPYYKWIKLHIGYRALNFNPYTYSGTAFNGLGVSLTPGAFELTTFAGKIQNRYAVTDTVVAGAVVLPSHDRKIQGLKIGFGRRSAKLSISAVRIKDDTDPNITTFTPLENIAFGLQTHIKLWKRIHLDANIASSIFTGDIEAETPDLLSEYERQIAESITINQTTRLSFAGDAFLGYDHRGYQLGFQYRRIDPFYQSLGTNYIQNDIINYTINAGLPLLERRLRLKGSFGIQNDNIKNHKAFTSHRVIAALSASYTPSPKYSYQLRYSNYQHQNESGLVLVNDTLKILTTTQSISANTMIQITDSESMSTSVNLSVFSNAVVDEARVDDGTIFRGTGASIRSNLTLKSIQLTLSPFINVNRFQYSAFNQGRYGGGITISKALLDKKWHNSLSLILNQNTYDGKANGTLSNITLSSRYKMSKQHNLNLRLFYINNDVLITEGYSEVRGNVSYGFTF